MDTDRDNPQPSDAPRPGVELAPGVRIPERAIRWTFTPSRGPGGQNVNRRSTRAQLRLRLADLPLVDPVRRRLRAQARRWITDADELLITSEQFRSQARNRAACLDRLRTIIADALRPPRVRRPTVPSRGARQRRIEAKKRRGQTKRLRQDPEP